MAEYTYLYLTIVTKVLMIVHFSRQEGISLHTQGFFQEEISCTSANGNALNRTRQQFVVHETFHAESLFYALQECQRVLPFWQIAYHANTCGHRVSFCANADRHLSWLQQHNIHQPKPLCHHVIDTIHS